MPHGLIPYAGYKGVKLSGFHHGFTSVVIYDYFSIPHEMPSDNTVFFLNNSCVTENLLREKLGGFVVVIKIHY
jgi:hypothetical protein